MSHLSLTPDGQVIVLLCSHLALSRREATNPTHPLTIREWNMLAKRILESPLHRPGALLDLDSTSRQTMLALTDSEADRIDHLMARGGQLAIELERLEQLGIWVLTRADANYPPRLKDRLGTAAPPVLFGAGDQRLVNQGFVAVVGSRDVDAQGAVFARRFGHRCGQEGLTVVSGMSRGVDRETMDSALQAGGTALGVLAEGLEKALRARETRIAVSEGRLALVTALHPRASFTAGTAMGRNKYIYCLAQYGLVVAAAVEKGGTRAGAHEVLKERWVPLFVRAGAEVPEGNRALLRQGALAFVDSTLEQAQGLVEWFDQNAGGWQAALRAPKATIPLASKAQRAKSSTQSSAKKDSPTSLDVFPLIRRSLLRALATAATVDELAATLAVERSQAQRWLDRAVQEGVIAYQPENNTYHPSVVPDQPSSGALIPAQLPFPSE